MAGLNFQTLTIINASKDQDSKGKILFGLVQYSFDGQKAEDTAKIKRDFLFAHKNIKAVRRAKGFEHKVCEAKIDFSKLFDMIHADNARTYCKLDIYLGVEGAEPFIYSTPWVSKGMPFWMEFVVEAKDTAETLAAKVKKTIEREHLFLCDKDLLNVAVEGAVLTLSGADEYQRFKKIEVSTFAADDEYPTIVEVLNVEKDSEAAIKLVERGLNAFGTYSQIIKDLRLPTAEHNHWTHNLLAETPILGAIYDQFIVEYCAPAVNDGLHAVGQRMDSHTTHVFWVKNDLSEDFKAIFGDLTVEEVTHPAMKEEAENTPENDSELSN